VNADEVATRVKTIFGDNDSIQLTDDSINNWMTDAQTEIALAASLLQVKASAIGTMPSMEMPADMLELHAVWWLNDTTSGNEFYEPLKFMSFADAQLTAPDNGQSGALVPVSYWIFGNTLTFVPYIPGVGGSVNLFYTKQPTSITAVNREFDIPVSYHPRILEYCLKQAYEMDENYEASAYKTTEFKDNLTEMIDQDAWGQHASYPTISVRPEDGGLEAGSYYAW